MVDQGLTIAVAGLVFGFLFLVLLACTVRFLPFFSGKTPHREPAQPPVFVETAGEQEKPGGGKE